MIFIYIYMYLFIFRYTYWCCIYLYIVYVLGFPRFSRWTWMVDVDAKGTLDLPFYRLLLAPGRWWQIEVWFEGVRSLPLVNKFEKVLLDQYCTAFLISCLVRFNSILRGSLLVQFELCPDQAGGKGNPDGPKASKTKESAKVGERSLPIFYRMSLLCCISMLTYVDILWYIVVYYTRIKKSDVYI